MNKFRPGFIGFWSILAIFLLIYASPGCIGGKVVESNSIENVEDQSVEKLAERFSPGMLAPGRPTSGHDILREYLSPAESIEFAGKIVGFEIVWPETDLKLQNVVVKPDWTGVYLIYSDKLSENIEQGNGYAKFRINELVINSSTIVIIERLDDINSSLTEQSAEFRINGNPASGRNPGREKMYRTDLEGRREYMGEGPYYAGRVDWYVVINSNQSVRYSIVGDLSLEELKGIAGTMKKPERVLIKPKPLPTRPPPISRPKAGEGTMETGS